MQWLFSNKLYYYYQGTRRRKERIWRWTKNSSGSGIVLHPFPYSMARMYRIFSKELSVAGQLNISFIVLQFFGILHSAFMSWMCDECARMSLLFLVYCSIRVHVCGNMAYTRDNGHKRLLKSTAVAESDDALCMESSRMIIIAESIWALSTLHLRALWLMTKHKLPTNRMDLRSLVEFLALSWMTIDRYQMSSCSNDRLFVSIDNI